MGRRGCEGSRGGKSREGVGGGRLEGGGVGEQGGSNRGGLGGGMGKEGSR